MKTIEEKRREWVEDRMEELSHQAMKELRIIIDGRYSLQMANILAKGVVEEHEDYLDIWQGLNLDLEHAYAILENRKELFDLLEKEWLNPEPLYERDFYDDAF